VVEALRLASLDEQFWLGVGDDNLEARVAALEPIARVVFVYEDQLNVIAVAFADIIDAKSSFTSGRSRRVTRYSDAIAANLGLTDGKRRWLRRGALLHDIGKIGVSTGVLDKRRSPAPITNLTVS
jgi:HD-GYP domain-containing protein (c-di-GMP phosphodiesterase class II)